MVLIRFHTCQSKLYKVELEPTTTISKVKESLSKEICNGVEPSKIKLLFKAKILKDDQTIESLHLNEKDFILIHAVLPKPHISYGQDIYPINSMEAFQIIQGLRVKDLPVPRPIPAQQPSGMNNQNGDPTIRIFRRALETEPRALENIISMFETAQPNIRSHIDLFLSDIGLNPSSFDIEGIRNRTAQPLDGRRFGMLLAHTCIELGINPAQFMNFPGSGAPPPRMGNISGLGSNPQQPLPPQAQLPPQQPPNQINQILSQFTPEEREAIQRLQQLGNFPLEYVVQIYIAADKNENMAANLLFGN